MRPTTTETPRATPASSPEGQLRYPPVGALSDRQVGPPAPVPGGWNDKATSAVLAWMADRQRDLPWRQTRDPWSVLVAETMLQQTQVARVIPKWHAFLASFPTVVVAAAASQAAFVRHWEGLGYNRRALQLHACAVAVTERFSDTIPDVLEDLLTLPGVGPYTARAVLAFAFERDVAVVDTNVGRVIARAVAGTPCRASEAQQLADALVPPGHGWLWNQAMLDLGALVCTKRNPKCSECPIVGNCAWRRNAASVADPAEGSAFVSTRQSRFAGSDRQGRGRLVKALRLQPLSTTELAQAMGWPSDPARAWRVAQSLVRDGLIAIDAEQQIVSLA